MKRLLLAAVFSLIAAPAAAQFGFSMSVGQPGFYGRVDIGGFPPPPLIFPAPVVIEHRVHVAGPPVYLHVPPGHAKHWSAHCAQYRACGQRVYFVQNNWYDDVYVPAYRERHGYRGDYHRDDYDRDDDDRGNWHDRGHGHGHGHGHGNGHGHGHGHGDDDQD
jgi:hypothetical protein